jgi:hypothetical protein
MIARILTTLMLGLGLCAAPVSAAKSIATITTIEGKASVLPTGAADWRDAKPGMPLKLGDQVYSRKESFVEIRYTDAAVLRMNESTKVVITSSTDKAVKSQTPLGNVWVNMQKITKARKTFELSSPTAVAAIRGTVYQMDTRDDSSTSVSVFEGSVDVGPTDGLKQSIQKLKTAPPSGPQEVPGPTEVPGPYEVSLEQWHAIVAGQKISVRNDGKFATEKIDTAATAKDAFVQKNLALDKALLGK